MLTVCYERNVFCFLTVSCYVTYAVYGSLAKELLSVWTQM
jgi:hypothetical protein